MSDIKDWYTKNYPDDEMGSSLNNNIGFKESYNQMKKGKDFYDIVGTTDSVIRERVFSQMAKENKKTYNDIYNTWLK